MTLPRIGIIIINYKDYAERFLADCRDSLRALDYPKDRYTVYIVDNATSPATQAYLAVQFPEAIVIPEATNAGWGGGNNIGAVRALADGSDDLVFANMDVVVDRSWLRELVAVAESDPNTGIVQSKILLHPVGTDGIPRINSIGNRFHFLGFGFCDGYKHPHDVRDMRIRDIGYASGAAMYVKGSVWERIGPCNAEFFMYHDDLEFSLKARLAGYRIVLAPASILWHKYEFHRSMRQVFFMERNRLLTVLEFYKIPTLLLLAPAFFIMECCVLAGGVLGGYARAKLQSWVYFFHLGNLRKLRAERQRIQGIRKIGDRELLQGATGALEFQEIANPALSYVLNPILRAYWWVAWRCVFW